MTETNQNLGTDEDPFIAGDDKILEVTVLDDVGNEFDITGAAITYTIREYPDSTPVVTKTVGDGITIINGVNGQLQIEITSADSQDLYGRYVHRCTVEKGGAKSHVFIGVVEVDK